LKICFEVATQHGPALRSALEEIANILGHRLESPHRYDKEETLTRAAVGVNTLRAAVTREVPKADPDYSGPPTAAKRHAFAEAQAGVQTILNNVNRKVKKRDPNYV
jgi:hypothetical protein